MFESFAQLFPADWQGAVLTLLAPMRWLAAWQSTIVLAGTGGSPALRVVALIALLMPALLIAAGLWCTVASIYTLPFRSGRGAFITSMLMAWWDAGRCIWLFWTGMLRVGIALVATEGGILLSLEKSWPTSFFISAISFAVYVAARIRTATAAR